MPGVEDAAQRGTAWARHATHAWRGWLTSGLHLLRPRQSGILRTECAQRQATPEGQTEGAWGLILTWPLGTGPPFGSLSPSTAGSGSLVLLAADFFPALVCLDCLVPEGVQEDFLLLVSSGTVEIVGKVTGSRGGAGTLCTQEGKLLPRTRFEPPPRDLFSWAAFLQGMADGRPPAAAAPR